MERQILGARRHRRTQQQIEALLADFNKSGVTVQEFCQKNNLSRGTFHKWQSRHKAEASKKIDKVGFASVVVNTTMPGLFAEVKGIRLFQPVSAAYLKELLA